MGASALGPVWWLVMGGRPGPLSTTREPGENVPDNEETDQELHQSCLVEGDSEFITFYSPNVFLFSQVLM